MSRPVTAQDVVSLVRRAGLAADPELTEILADLPAGPDPARLLAHLVAAGLLTRYQADELSVGRCDGFWFRGYKVLDRLGRGGMGHVYLAEHAVLRRLVAVKVLSTGMQSDPAARRRFYREARAAAAVDHPNVVRVHDVDMEHDPPFLVMEYVDGVSVQAAVARHGAFAPGEAAAVGTEVARGLAAAAAAGLVHRDVKPANLLVDRRGGVKILDLGIVRFPGDDTHPRLDPADVILGTLDYLAPEQAVDYAAVDARADLYALGATLYFTLAGHPPFPGSDLRYKIVAKQHSDPPPVHCLRPDVGPELSAVIHTLLARDPADRYPTASAAAAALAPFAAPPPNFPHRLFRSERPSTADDPPPEASSALPDTQRIAKPVSRAVVTVRAEEERPTDELKKIPTELAMVPLPRQPAHSPADRTIPPAPFRLGHVLRAAVWLLLAAAALAATILLR